MVNFEEYLKVTEKLYQVQYDALLRYKYDLDDKDIEHSKEFLIAFSLLLSDAKRSKRDSEIDLSLFKGNVDYDIARDFKGEEK